MAPLVDPGAESGESEELLCFGHVLIDETSGTALNSEGHCPQKTPHSNRGKCVSSEG